MRHLPLLTILVLTVGILAWNLKLQDASVSGTVWAGAERSEARDGAATSAAPEHSLRLSSGPDLGASADRRVALGVDAKDARVSEGAGDEAGPAPPTRGGTTAGPDVVLVFERRSDGTSSGARSRTGARIGLWKDTWPDGTLRRVGEYAADDRDGLWEFFYEDGAKHKEGAYAGGLREGPWTTWHPNGERMQAATYQQGRMDGFWQEWYSNGQVKEAGRYLNGRREGWWQFFHYDGAVDIRTGTYAAGRRIDR